MDKMFVNKIINDIEYTLVDIIEYLGKNVKCYLCDDDYAFTISNDGNEKLITNLKIIQNIKNQENLNPPQVYYYNFLLNILATDLVDMDEERKNDIISKFMEKIKEIQFDVDIEEIEKRARKVKFVYGSARDLYVGAFYYPLLNTIVVGPDDNDYDTLFHELIHACGGSLFNTINFNQSGFIEGGTEITNRKMAQDFNEKGSYVEKIIFDCNAQCYIPQVTILRQMEYLLNDNCASSMLNGKKDFFIKFKRKYGYNLYRFLQHRTTKMYTMMEKGLDITNIYMDTQNRMLRTVFDKELTDVKDLESAKLYMERLKAFEYMMGIETEKVELNIFEAYYKEKNFQLVEMLKKLNVKKEEINEFVSNYAYEKPTFKKIFTKEEELDLALKGCSIYAKRIMNDNQSKDIDIEKIELYVGTGSKCSIVSVLTYDDFPVVYIKETYGETNYYSGEWLTSELLKELTKVKNGFEVEIGGEIISVNHIESDNIKAKIAKTIKDTIMGVTENNFSSLEKETSGRRF